MSELTTSTTVSLQDLQRLVHNASKNHAADEKVRVVSRPDGHIALVNSDSQLVAYVQATEG